MDSPELVSTIQSGGVALLRTDTIYGILGRADLEETVERIYTLKQRRPDKSPIVLIDSLDQLFDSYDEATLTELRRLWPGKVSIILPSTDAPSWIKRGNHSVAYRMPDHSELRALLHQTGPLIAPSANPEGLVPATTIDEAKQYFGDRVDVYVDGDKVTDNTPSALYRSDGGTLTRLR